MKQKITKKGYKKENRGITLVALVVTIVVLLILAGVTISLIMNNSSIIKRAMDARDDTKNAVNKEIADIEDLGSFINGALAVTKKEHTKANLTATEDNGDIKGMNYTWSELYNVSKAISKTTVADDVREITVNLNGKNYTVGIGDEATVYYNGTTEKTVRLIGFNHDTVVDRKYGAEKAGMTFEFVDVLGTHNMNGTDIFTSTNADGWAATEMREYLNGYNSKTTNTALVGVKGGEALKIKETSGGTETLKIQKVKKDYLKDYNSANLNAGTSTALMSGTPSEDYLWLLSCAEIWNDGSQTTGKGNAMGVEGSQYAFYKDATAGFAYNSDNSKIVKASSNCWLRSPYYDRSDAFCLVFSVGACFGTDSYDANGVAPGFSI